MEIYISGAAVCDAAISSTMSAHSDLLQLARELIASDSSAFGIYVIYSTQNCYSVRFFDIVENKWVFMNSHFRGITMSVVGLFIICLDVDVAFSIKHLIITSIQYIFMIKEVQTKYQMCNSALCMVYSVYVSVAR